MKPFGEVTRLGRSLGFVNCKLQSAKLPLAVVRESTFAMTSFVRMVVVGLLVLSQAQAACVYGRSVPKIKTIPPLQYPVQAALVKNFSGLFLM